MFWSMQKIFLFISSLTKIRLYYKYLYAFEKCYLLQITNILLIKNISINII